MLGHVERHVVFARSCRKVAGHVGLRAPGIRRRERQDSHAAPRTFGRQEVNFEPMHSWRHVGDEHVLVEHRELDENRIVDGALCMRPGCPPDDHHASVVLPRRPVFTIADGCTMIVRPMPLPDYTAEPFTHHDTTHPVYWRGEGPGVIVIHEIPGITPPVLAFANRIVAAGYTVAMPTLFGTPGKPESPTYMARSVLRGCVSREFSVLSRHEASPITDWLRALARHLHERAGGPGVGAVGMCFTGNFALAMMLEPAMLAPVLSQPSLPFGVSGRHRAALHASDDTVEAVGAKLKQHEGRLLALRFTHDRLCPAARFATLRNKLGPQVETIEIDSGPGNAFGISRQAHSVLTRDFVDEAGHPTRHALDRVLTLFDEQLRPA